jgi:transposase
MTKKKRHPRDEVLYNKVQESEFLHFFEFVRYVSMKVSKGKKMKEIITCLLIWHKFPNLSARRAKSFLLFLKWFKVIKVDLPCFKTLCNYRSDSILQSILDELIEESSKSLAKIEHDFATDMSGAKTKLFSSWYSLRCKKKIRKRDHLKEHITTGVKSNIVTAVDVLIERGKDNILMREHVDKTSKNFKINEWSGDGMYWCKLNCKKIVEVGGKPYFKVHKNWSGKSRGGFDWKQMNLEFKKDEEEYGKHYHKRSNVEATFHSKKALHGDKIYSKLNSAKINEEILRWICHNQTVLNRAKHEWNIIPSYME